MSRKQCAFCGSATAKISNEHAWPNWIRPLLPPTVSTIIGTRLSNKPITYPGRQDDMGVKVNAVCKPCNEGWMERLETDVRSFMTPMIRDGKETALSCEQQLTLAMWVTKTAMVFEFTNSSTPFYSLEDRNALHNGRLMGATVIWVARYEGAQFLSTAVAKGLEFDVGIGNRISRHPGSGFTLFGGQFATQIVTVRTPPEVAGMWMRLPREFEASAEVLWPRPGNEPLRWPPGPSLTDETLEAFMGRFVEDQQS